MNYLAVLRQLGGYTSRDKFAKILGFRPHTYRAIERGERTPTLDEARILADFFDVNILEIMGDYVTITEVLEYAEAIETNNKWAP